jgi:hypothetical protein
MAKKQTRRSISVSRNAYERLKAFCETSGVSMSQFVESGIHEKLDESGAAPASAGTSAAPQRPSFVPLSTAPRLDAAPRAVAPARPAPAPAPAPRTTPMITSAAARFAVEPPPPIIKPRPVEQEPKAPAEPTPGQIFTF